MEHGDGHISVIFSRFPFMPPMMENLADSREVVEPAPVRFDEADTGEDGLPVSEVIACARLCSSISVAKLEQIGMAGFRVGSSTMANSTIHSANGWQEASSYSNTDKKRIVFAQLNDDISMAYALYSEESCVFRSDFSLWLGKNFYPYIIWIEMVRIFRLFCFLIELISSLTPSNNLCKKP